MTPSRWTFAQKRRLAPSTQERELVEAVQRCAWDDAEDWFVLGVDRKLSQPLLHTVLSQGPSRGTRGPKTVEQVTVLVERFRQDVNQVSATGFTALHSALLYGPLDAMVRLLDLGAAPNHPRDPYPLWLIAMHNGHYPLMAEKALCLWRAGVDVDARTPAGLSELPAGLTDREVLARARQKLPTNPGLIALEPVLNVVHEDRALRVELDALGGADVRPARPPRRL